MEIAKFVLDIVVACCQIAVILIAKKALDQVDEQRQQNRLTRETVAIDELRHFEKFIINYQKTIDSIESKNITHIPLEASEMIDFSLPEAHSNSEFKTNNANWHKFYQAHNDILSDMTQCANSLEVIATALIYGTANLKIVENSISHAFCRFVEHNSYIYVRTRSKTLNLYPNTIKLYHIFKPNVKTMDQQLHALKEEFGKLLTE